MKAIPMPGPLEADPAGTVDLATARAQLDEVTSGLPLGAWDQQVIEQFGAMATPVIAPVSLIATVASWLRRARNAGVEAGRREAVDTTPAVDVLAAEVNRLTHALRACRDEVAELQQAIDETRNKD